MIRLHDLDELERSPEPRDVLISGLVTVLYLAWLAVLFLIAWPA